MNNTPPPVSREKKLKSYVVFALSDEQLLDQIEDVNELKEIKQLADFTYKIILK